MSNLPALHKPVQKSKPEQYLVLLRKMQETKQDLDHSWQDLKRDSITAAIGVVTTYVGYRIIGWLFAPSKKQKDQKRAKEPEIRYVEVREPRQKNTWTNMLLNRAGSIITNIILEKVRDNFSITTKKDTN